MKRVSLLLGLILLAMLAMAPSVFAVGYAGQNGPYDTKAVVNSVYNSSDGTYSLSVAVMFTPKNGLREYAVYKFNLSGATGPFDPVLWKRTFDKVSSCKVAATVDANLGVVTDLYKDSSCTDSNWQIDTTYKYVKYIDSNIAGYKEYYYFVDDDQSGSGLPSDSSSHDLNKYVITPAFPPTQTRHGNYSEYTNACNACHGLHSSKHVKLLKGPTSTDLCGTCHDGTGSKYDEVRGYVRTGPSWSSKAYAAAGPFGDRLKHGSGIETTSVHNVMRVDWNYVDQNNPSGDSLDASKVFTNSARIWQAPGFYYRNGDDSNRWLGCINCHEPHNKFKNYRLLRGQIEGRKNIVVRGVSATQVLPENTSDRGNWQSRYMYTKYLSGGNDTDGYANDPAGRGGTMGGVVSFCTACHRSFAVEPRTNSTMPSDPSIIFAAPKSQNFDCPSGECQDKNNAYPGTVPGSVYDTSSSTGRVPPGSHKHPVDVEAFLAPVIEGQIQSGGNICTPDPSAGSSGYNVWIDSSMTNAKSNCKQGRVLDPIVPLEGTNGSPSAQQQYWKNSVVCLTCHVPHGSGSERLEVAWKNNGLNDTQSGERDKVTGYLWNRAGDNAFMQSNGHPTSPGQINPQWGTGSGRPELFVDTSPYWTQFGFSSALARFNPFASACYRCHSRTTAQ